MHEVNDLRNEWNWVRGKLLICIHWIVLHSNKYLLRCVTDLMFVQGHIIEPIRQVFGHCKNISEQFFAEKHNIYRNLIFNYSRKKRFSARSSINYNRHKRFTIPCRFQKECIFILIEATRLIILLAFVYMNSRPI